MGGPTDGAAPRDDGLPPDVFEPDAPVLEVPADAGDARVVPPDVDLDGPPAAVDAAEVEPDMAVPDPDAGAPAGPFQLSVDPASRARVAYLPGIERRFGVVWNDEATGAGLFAARALDGQPLEVGPLVVSALPDERPTGGDAEITGGPAGFRVAWPLEREAKHRLVSPDGAYDAAAFSVLAGDVLDPVVEWSPRRGAWLVAAPTDGEDIRLAVVGRDGRAEARTVTDTARAVNLATTEDGGGGFYLAYDADQGDDGRSAIRVVRLADPLPLADDPLQVATLVAADVALTDPALAYDAQQHLAAAWVREEAGVRFARFQREDFTRQVMPARFGSDAATEPDLVKGDNGEFALVWTDEVDGESAVHFSRIRTGRPEASAPRRISPRGQDARDPHLVWTGSVYGVVWTGDTDGTRHVYLDVGRFDDPFEPLLAAPVRVDAEHDEPMIAIARSTHPGIAWAGGARRFGVVFDAGGDTWIRRYRSSGAAIWPAERVSRNLGPPSERSLVTADRATGRDFLVGHSRGRDGYTHVVAALEPVPAPAIGAVCMGDIDVESFRARSFGAGYMCYAADGGEHRFTALDATGALVPNEDGRVVRGTGDADIAPGPGLDALLFYRADERLSMLPIADLARIQPDDAALPDPMPTNIRVAWDDAAAHVLVAGDHLGGALLRRVDVQAATADEGVLFEGASEVEVARGGGDWGVAFVQGPGHETRPPGVYVTRLSDGTDVRAEPVRVSATGSAPQLAWGGSAWGVVWTDGGLTPHTWLVEVARDLLPLD